MSSHQRIVTRSPNHMCAISWAITDGAAAALVVGGPAAGEQLVAVGHAARASPARPSSGRARRPGRRSRTGTARRRAPRSGRSRPRWCARSSSASRSSSAARERAGVPAERQPGVLPATRVPRPGAHHEQRDRDRRRRGEPPAAVPGGAPRRGRWPAPSRPGRRHGQGDRRLEVVLVEAGEDPLGHVHPEYAET